VIIVQGNGTFKTILVNKKLGVETKKPQIFICYDLMEGLTNEENLIFEIEPKLFSIGIITISNETISLLNVGIIEIKINV
jgi:glycerol-3-phosphate responsive antiterminator